MFKKYWTIIKTTFERGITYRFTIFFYRFGEILENLVLILMWMAIYKNQPFIQDYTLREMVTYILVGNLINTVVRNWLNDVVSYDIKDGRLSTFLIKPISYTRYIFFREIGRVGVPFLFSFSTQIIIILFFLDKFIFNKSLAYLGVIFIMIVLAFILEMFISYIIGLVAFWTLEVDGLYATIFRVKRFFSGGYFPLSFLPPVLLKTSYALPFAYSFFVPTQLYLKKIDITAGLKGIGVQLVWIILLYLIIKIVWRRGLKKYEGVGI